MSIEKHKTDIHQIVVADDSDDNRVLEVVDQQSLEVIYIKGPRVGLGANRNAALDRATEDYVLFLDDDAELGPDYLRIVRDRLRELPQGIRERTIVTGAEVQHGRAITPSEQGILGFQNRPYQDGEPMRTVVINATLFPRGLFQSVRFDPLLRYGYDEVDMTTQAVEAGFTIIPCFNAVNYHFPSQINRHEYQIYMNASRLYVTLKRRRWTEQRPLRAWLGFGLAVSHVYLGSIRRKSGIAGMREARRTVGQSLAYYANFVNMRAQTTQ
jgi:glycosyltransferase involved in cell wall biosynthesis